MRIEDHWNDVGVYNIEFVVQQKDCWRIIEKIVVFDSESEHEMSAIIKNKFNNVVKINFIDSIGDGLHLKKEE